MGDEEKPTSAPYSNSKFSSSLTSIKSFLSGSVKKISNKTVEYGSSLGSTVKNISINLYEKGMGKSNNTEINKKSKENNPTVKKDTGFRKKSADWS